MKEIIEINNLCFAYKEDTILNKINLKINQGDFAAFIGPNGSGKSTLLKLITGSLKPMQGQIKLFNTPVEEFNDWAKVGYVSQKVRSFNDSFPATVREIIGASLYRKMGFFKLLTNKLENEIDRVLDLVGMLDYKARQIGNLSGGQQQRIFIARILINQPEIILLDEPLVGLDIKAQEEFYRLLNNLSQELDITIVMISHDIHVISNQADKIVCFKKGQVFTHQAENFNYNDYFRR
ncbi:ATPase component of Mn/Zn ABC-type transporter [Halobacteroides halobius DSM 5150]|uniref:ATPase component of Mn/Zn ABC-type transporter n=1 Tax=Halobacteroides halobius (strain ATCC 35273 / DSM 5150 / MD-1) TaxID=748449 RepID=L0K975_HALHC|nr:metal ABC transporter ATP-binding protein [Halobacteroides halobius]AGB41571.1 ATPase component of Mn/Zn ABC-type transporter [Halobacteroides halobius DSM 5150]